jgi:hypothetical protein
MCSKPETFVTDISASTGRNDLIFDIWLWHGDLYRVSPFQAYRTSTSCLPCDLEFKYSYMVKQDVACYVVLRIPPLVHLCQICIYLNTHYQKMP